MANESAKVLDRLSNKMDGASDYRLAQLLEVSRQHVSLWRKDRSMSDDAAIRAAELMGENPDAVLAEIAAERAKSDTARKRWLALARRLQRSAAAALIAAALLSTHSPHAQAGTSASGPMMYIM